MSSRIEGGVVLTRALDVAVPADRLWSILRDIEAVARCLPGAVIESVTPDGAVTGAFEVAIGPMPVPRFRGAAQVTYERAARTGEVRGAGADGLSRSRADGVIRFAARQRAGGSTIDLTMTYKLSGPLAQFGRPSLVASVVDQVLVTFAANLAQAAQGGRVAAPAPISGIRFLFGALYAIVRRPFS